MDAPDALASLAIGNERHPRKCGLILFLFSSRQENKSGRFGNRFTSTPSSSSSRPFSYDQGFPDEARFSVDALVADSAADDVGPRSLDAFNTTSRSSTPSVPPGFGLPHGHPSPAFREDAVGKLPSRIVPTSAPFTPSRNTSSTFTPRAATPLASIPRGHKSLETPISRAKHDIASLAAQTGLSKIIASNSAKTSSSQSTLQSEDFPALESHKANYASTATSATTPTKATAPLKLTPLGASNKKAPAIPPSSNVPASLQTVNLTEKRAPPGILNISVSTKPSPKISGAPGTPVKSTAASSAFPALPAGLPASASTQSARNTPKTLRVNSTPKAEITTGIANSSSAAPIFSPPSLPFGQPTLTSFSRLERPDTPASEIISDNASITSASMSRASSPPPSKVGSAPVRVTTKSMQKKQRREAQKEKEKSGVEPTTAKPEPEVEIAPIMGRKKKQKRDKPIHSAAGGSTPAVSRPQTPGPTEPTSEEIGSHTEILEQPAVLEKPAQVEMDVSKIASKVSDLKGKGKAKAQRPVTPEPVIDDVPPEDDVVDKPIPTPASVLQSLISSGFIADPSTLNILKHPGLNGRQEPLIDMQNLTQKLTITPEDRAALLAGQAVHKVKEGPNRIMLTPNGDCVRNLTPEEEERYLELQSRIAKELGPTAFFSARHHTSNGFSLVGGRAVPNGPPAFFPLSNGNNVTMDPVSKIQRDEALSYINQYVLPSLSTNSQLEKALNANALDAEILRSNESSPWASWDSDPSIPRSEHAESAYGSENHEGILATGLESMTAHFAVGRDTDRGQPLGNVSLLSLADAESAMQMARKETETLEKKFNNLLKKNRRLLLGSGH